MSRLVLSQILQTVITLKCGLSQSSEGLLSLSSASGWCCRERRPSITLTRKEKGDKAEQGGKGRQARKGKGGRGTTTKKKQNPLSKANHPSWPVLNPNVDVVALWLASPLGAISYCSRHLYWASLHHHHQHKPTEVKPKRGPSEEMENWTIRVISRKSTMAVQW